MTAAPSQNDLANRIADLSTLSLDGLRTAWRDALGVEPPDTRAAGFLRQELSWRLQARVYGDLDPNTQRELARLGRQRDPDQAQLRVTAAGSTLIKEWNGRTYTVVILKEGYLFNGDVYSSLSAIARKITGTHWSGPRFFRATR